MTHIPPRGADRPNLTAAGFVDSLMYSPLLEELALCIPDRFGVSSSGASTVELIRRVQWIPHPTKTLKVLAWRGRVTCTLISTC